jgi:hypothetical protein
MEVLDTAKVEIPENDVLEVDLALALLTTHLREQGDPMGADEVRSLQKRIRSYYATASDFQAATPA